MKELALGASAPDLIEAYGRFETVRLDAGAEVMQQDQPPDRFLVIVRGMVDVVRRDPDGKETYLANLGPGTCLGETGLIRRAPLGASVIARTQVELLAMDPEEFRRLMQRAG